MKLIKATEADSERLKAFFERMLLPGAIDFSIRREGSFFDQYRLFSNDSETVMLLDDPDESGSETIAGMASLLFKEGFVRGEKQTWGYATDLRIAPTRKAISQWAQRFLPALEAACEERRCKYVFSAVQLHDNQAYNALIRPASHTRRRLPRYHLVNRFRVMSIHGRIPFSDKPLSTISVSEMHEDDIEPLCAYLRDRAKKQPLAKINSPENFLDEISRWPGLDISDFRIAKDSRDRIMGCAAMWNGREVQSFIPQTYHGFANTLHQTLKLAGSLRLVRPTVEPEIPMPNRLLTHLACDTPEVFHGLVDEAFGRLGTREFLSYIHFRGNWRTLPPRSFVATSLPFGFYMIVPPTAETPVWQAPQTPGNQNPSLQQLPPDFDIAWL
jgi:hypothetical protein